MICKRKENWKEIREYAYDLVIENKVSYQQLTREDKMKLTGMIMKGLDKHSMYEYITEADKNETLPNTLTDLLLVDNETNKEDLIDLLIDNACEYASKEIDDLLRDLEEQYNLDKKFFFDE
jgi:hypothetical protein